MDRVGLALVWEGKWIVDPKQWLYIMLQTQNINSRVIGPKHYRSTRYNFYTQTKEKQSQQIITGNLNDVTIDPANPQSCTTTENANQSRNFNI